MSGNASYRMTWDKLGSNNSYLPLVQNQSQHSSANHSHEFYELVYVEHGFCLHFSGDNVGLLMAGDLIAMVPEQAHYYRCRNNVEILNILFMPESLEGFMDDINALPGMQAFFSGDVGNILHASLSLSDRSLASRIIREMKNERYSRQPGHELRCKVLLIDLIVLLSRVFGMRFPKQKSSSSDTYMGYVMSAIEMIEEGFQGDLSIGGLAKDIGISPDHLTRQFKQVLGITPTEYIRRFRYARALELLRKQCPVQAVCAQTGFKQHSYFSREFKVLFNMTPTEFQKQVRDKLVMTH